jgi:hypothetical protein
MSRRSYNQGQRDGSKNRYRPCGKSPLLAGIFGWSRSDERKKRAYDNGWANGRKNRKR